MNKIKEFLGTNAKQSVLADAETAGKLLAEILEWEESKSGRILWRGIPFDYSDVTDDAYLSLVHAFEKAVIEKVGASEYGKALCKLLFNSNTAEVYGEFATLATADAPTRVAAMLMALAGEKE